MMNEQTNERFSYNPTIAVHDRCRDLFSYETRRALDILFPIEIAEES